MIRKIGEEKKAQIKIMETAFVLLAIVLLAVVGFIFYSRFQLMKIREEAAELQRQAAISLLERLSAMPELRCSETVAVTIEKLCIDKDKLLLFKALEYADKEYRGMWQGLSQVKIMQVVPAEESWTLYEVGPANLTYSTFVSICSQERLGYRCGAGLILVSI